MREIGFSALSLDLEGVASMLGATLADKLGPQHLQAILEQTEGWPAAVRMMQIVMAKSDEPETLLKQFSGSDQDLVALLNRQVLDGLPSELRAFLLCWKLSTRRWLHLSPSLPEHSSILIT